MNILFFSKPPFPLCYGELSVMETRNIGYRLCNTTEVL